MSYSAASQKTIPVAVYARVSTEHDEQLYALENQKKWYMDLIANHPEWQFIEMYVDEGITGTSTKKRKSFNRMIDDAKAGRFKLILTRETSRFARNVVDCLTFSRELKKYGVGIYFINDNINTTDEDGEFRLSLFATFAEDESRKMSQRVRAGFESSMKSGVPLGNGNILGYDKVHGEYKINLEQAKTVRYIFDMALEGHGLRKIKYLLENGKYKTSKGKYLWYESTISRILDNKFYYGMIEYHKYISDGYLTQNQKRNYDEDSKIYRMGKHEPIITKEEFDKVQELRGKRRKRVDSEVLKARAEIGIKPESDCWTRLLVCGDCGKGFTRNRWHVNKETGEIQYAYQCRTQKNTTTPKTREKRGLSTEGICRVPYLPEWKLHMATKYVLDKCVTETDAIIQCAKTVLERTISREEKVKNRIREELEELETQNKKLVAKKKKVFDLLLDDVIDKATYTEKCEEIEAEIASNATRISELKDEADASLNPEDGTFLLSNLKNQLDTLKDFVKLDKIPQGIIEAFILKIVVYEDRLEFYLKYHGDLTINVTGKRKNNAEITPVNTTDACPRIANGIAGNNSQCEEKIVFAEINLSPVEQFKYKQKYANKSRAIDDGKKLNLQIYL